MEIISTLFLGVIFGFCLSVVLVMFAIIVLGGIFGGQLTTHDPEPAPVPRYTSRVMTPEEVDEVISEVDEELKNLDELTEGTSREENFFNPQNFTNFEVEYYKKKVDDDIE